MLFLTILVLRNHTKPHTLLFYWFLILIGLSRQVYWLVFVFFSFLLLINYLKNVLLYDSLVQTLKGSFLFVVRSLISLCFITFFMVLPKTALFINLKMYFSKSFFPFFLSSAFISMYGFNQDSWLNLMTLRSFSNTNSRFNVCFKYLMCIFFFIMQAGYKLFKFSNYHSFRQKG